MKKIVLILFVILASCSAKKITENENTLDKSSDISTYNLTIDESLEENEYIPINIDGLFNVYIIKNLPEDMYFEVLVNEKDIINDDNIYLKKSGGFRFYIEKDGYKKVYLAFLYGDEEYEKYYSEYNIERSENYAEYTYNINGQKIFIWLWDTNSLYDDWKDNNIQNQAPEIYQKLFVIKDKTYLEKYSIYNIIKFKNE